MLKTIQIKNFALIESIEIEFSSGLNIITGETGAGKSIIVDALMMLFGERASTDLIRQNADKAIIEGIFEIEHSHQARALLNSDDFEINGSEISLRRELNRKGNSRCFINDTPVQVSILKRIGELLVDFHGQHDHQSLLKPENHIIVLDSTGNYSKKIEKYKHLYVDLKVKIEHLLELKAKENQLSERKELLNGRINDINKINPQINEDNVLSAELNILENAETLLNLTAQVHNLAEESDHSFSYILSQFDKIINDIAQIEPRFIPYRDEVKALTISFNEIVRFNDSYHSEICFDSARIDEIRLRLTEINKLIKKYGSIEAIIQEKENIETELNRIHNYNDDIENLKSEIRDLQSNISKTATELTLERSKHSKVFSDSILSTLQNLGISNAKFEIKIYQQFIPAAIDDIYKELISPFGTQFIVLFPDGVDKVEFYISANKGEETKPLANVASGGEISRIMLAIKSIVARSDYIKLLIFDEIDSGISGRIAQKVGVVMKKLAREKQIIAITHLPQIAAFGDYNISVKKIETKEGTVIKTDKLNSENKIVEIARLISGEKISESALLGAKELAEEAAKLD